MGRAATDRVSLDWEKIGEFADLEDVVRAIPPQRVVEILGVQRIIEAIGLPRIIEALGPERLLDLFALVPEEQFQNMVRQRQERESHRPSGVSSCP